MLRSLSIRDIVVFDRLDLDLAGGLCALTGETGAGKSILLDSLGLATGQRAEGRVVTIAVDKMKFIRPVHVGDVLCIYTSVGRVGTSSMEIRIEAWALRHRYGHREKVTEAIFTMVAVDDSGKPRPVPTQH